MAKNSGPCFEFEMERNGTDISFVFYPGNVSEHEFNETVETLVTAFRDTFGENNGYIKRVKRTIVKADNEEKEINTISIYQARIISVARAIIGNSPYSKYKIHFIGENKNGKGEEMLITNYTEALEAKRLVPMYNKNNNDLTTLRRK